MRKIIFSIVFATSILSSVGTFAAEPKYYGDWRLYVDNASSQAFSNGLNSSISLRLMLNKSYQTRIFFYTDEKDCAGFSDDIEDAEPIRINGQMIKFSMQCTSKGRIAFFASTARGAEFIIDAFKKQKTVTVHSGSEALKFSGNGFTRTYREVSNFNSAI